MFNSFKSKNRVEKTSKRQRSFKDSAKASRLQKSFNRSFPSQAALLSPLITLIVGSEGRLFAAHHDVLCQSPFLSAAIGLAAVDPRGKKCLSLEMEEPEVFAAVLEYLYKGDYTPRIVSNERTGRAEIASCFSADRKEHTIYLSAIDTHILRDTVVYTTAHRFGLEGLKKLALRKQGMATAIDCATVLRSARYAYDNTPDTDAQLRAHYLALIIRCRKTFKRSGTMQLEMESGGKIWFDLFVALCNHLDDVVEVATPQSNTTSRF